MGKIIVLDELTACKIAAGEVIERPASVVKEMVENSIDAGASSVSVEIKAGGVKLIRVTDNGRGFEPDDAVLAFEKHATSKISHAEDLERVSTLGFRGEALASIAAVADVTLISRTAEAKDSIYVHIQGGDVVETGVRGSAKGTVITVRDLFYNTPARYKFLKKDSTEASYVSEVILRLALAHSEISFRLISDGKPVIQTPGNGDLLSTIYSLYGKGVSSSLLPVQYRTAEGLCIQGYVGVRDAIYGTRSRQTFFVNGRYIRSKVLTSALDEAYKTVTMKGKFPFAVLCLTLSPTLVDVNVHPAKTEVRFANDSAVFQCVYQGVAGALFDQDGRNAIGLKSAASAPATPAFSQVKTPERAAVPEKNAPMTASAPTTPAFSQVKTPERAAVPEKNAPMTASAPATPAFSQVKTPERAAVPEKNTLKAEHQAIQTFLSVLEEGGGKNLQPEAGIQEDVIPGGTSVVAEASAQSFLKQPEGSVPYRDHSVYTDSRIVGQVFQTYLVLQHGDDLVLLDQHAAHERILYEALRQSLSQDRPVSQLLLTPMSLSLSPTEFLLLKQNLSFFEKLGFEIEEFGSQDMVVRAVPTVLSEGNILAVILEGLERIQKGGSVSLYADESIHSMACKAAVKAHKTLSLPEMQALLDRLAQLPNGETCPHGRPIVVRFSQRELEKKFKRIV